MSDFVKSIVKLARKYRASEADALLIRNHYHIITASCSAYGKLKNLIL